MSLDAILTRQPVFSLEVSLNEPTSSAQQTSTETERSTPDAQPILKSYVVDLRCLRDNAPPSGDASRLDEILDILSEEVKRHVSDNANQYPENLISFEV